MQDSGIGKRPQARSAMVKRGAACLFLAGLLGLPAPATGADWDVRVEWLHTMRPAPPSPQGEYTINDKNLTNASTFVEGEPVAIFCRYDYVQVGAAKSFTPWTARLTVNGKTAYTATIAQYEDPHANQFVFWYAGKPGAYQIGCVLEGLPETDYSNNSLTVPITVTYLPAGDIPVPTPISPSPNQLVTFEPNLVLMVKGQIPKKPVGGKLSFDEYAKSTPHDEQWHIAIYRTGPEDKINPHPIEEISGKVLGPDFATALTVKTLAKTGNYDAKYSLSQTVNGVMTKGPSIRVGFRLAGPPTLDGPPAPMVAKPPPAPIPPPALPKLEMPAPPRAIETPTSGKPAVTAAAPHAPSSAAGAGHLKASTPSEPAPRRRTTPTPTPKPQRRAVPGGSS